MKKQEKIMTEKIKALEITVLNDNEPGSGLKNDWGWSAIIESDQWKILFDADTRPDVIEKNSRILGIDLNNIDFAFLSHYHLDHYGGFEYIGKIKKNLRVYTPEKNAILENFGLEPVALDHETMLYEHVYSTGPLKGFFIREHGLVIEGDGFNVLMVGCSHPGIENLVMKAREIAGYLYLTIGGFHGPSRSQIDRVAMESRYISPAHCSGDDAKNYVKSKYIEKYVGVRTGSRIRIPF